MDGLDEARSPRWIAERLPDLAHRRSQDCIADRGIRPCGRQKFLLRHQQARLAQQALKHGKRLTAQGDTLVAHPQALVEYVELEPLKPNVTRLPHLFAFMPCAAPEVFRIPSGSSDFAAHALHD